MKSNLGLADRIIRILIAATIGILYFTNQITGTYAIVAMVIAVVFLATSFINFCPLYYLLGLSSKKKSIKA